MYTGTLDSGQEAFRAASRHKPDVMRVNVHNRQRVGESTVVQVLTRGHEISCLAEGPKVSISATVNTEQQHRNHPAA